MLRYYDEKGLLKPKKDEMNGYRYFTNEDIAIANKIKLLRKYHFSIDEMKNVLEMDAATIKGKYEQKIAQLYEKTIEYYRVTSTSKQFTAFAILLLEQEGKLSLDDSILKYVPSLGAYAEPVTLRHLIHHTGGLVDYIELAKNEGILYSDCLTAK